jgi:hypothetical protein
LCAVTRYHYDRDPRLSLSLLKLITKRFYPSIDLLHHEALLTALMYIIERSTLTAIRVRISPHQIRILRCVIRLPHGIRPRLNMEAAREAGNTNLVLDHGLQQTSTRRYKVDKAVLGTRFRHLHPLSHLPSDPTCQLSTRGASIMNYSEVMLCTEGTVFEVSVLSSLA